MPEFDTSSSHIPRELVSFGKCSNLSACGPMGVQSSRIVKLSVGKGDLSNVNDVTADERLTRGRVCMMNLRGLRGLPSANSVVSNLLLGIFKFLVDLACTLDDQRLREGGGDVERTRM